MSLAALVHMVAVVVAVVVAARRASLCRSLACGTAVVSVCCPARCVPLCGGC